MVMPNRAAAEPPPDQHEKWKAYQLAVETGLAAEVNALTGSYLVANPIGTHGAMSMKSDLLLIPPGADPLAFLAGRLPPVKPGLARVRAATGWAEAAAGRVGFVVTIDVA